MPGERQQHPDKIDQLLDELGAFLHAETLERERFLHLVELLHGLGPAERLIAYEHLMRATTHEKMSAADDERVRLLGRLADLVDREPPAPGTTYGAVLADRPAAS